MEPETGTEAAVGDPETGTEAGTEAGTETTETEADEDTGDPGTEVVPDTDAIFTIPNMISFSRVLLLPLLVWAVSAGAHGAAALVLAGMGVTDYLDGVAARQLKQVSKLGQVLDPICDRIALGGAIIVLLVAGDIPAWVAWVLIARDLIVSAGTIALGLLGFPRIAPTWTGKSATLLLMFGMPLFLLSVSGLDSARLARLLAWAFGLPGIALYYAAMLQYMAKAWSLRGERAVSRAGSAGGTADPGADLTVA